jgi:MFS family permease
MLGCILLFEIKQTDKTTLSGKDEEALKEPLKNDHEPVKINSLGIRYEDPNEGLSISQVLRLPSFYILTLMLFNFGFAPFLVVSYYKAFGQTFITNDNFLSIIGSVSSLFNAFGRLLWGYLVDKLPFKICYLIQSTICICLVASIYFIKYIRFYTEMIYLIWVCCIFLAQCGIWVILPTAVAKCFGQRNFTSVYGLIFLLCVK